MSALLETSTRRAIEDEIERLIGMLDQFDGEPDLEEPGDMEPWLGWTDRGPSALNRHEPHDDCEREDEHYEDGGDDEPWLGAPEWHPSGHLWDGHKRGSQLQWTAGASDDREYECEDEGAGNA